jgi:hypothetical protein
VRERAPANVTGVFRAGMIFFSIIGVETPAASDMVVKHW